MPPHQQQCHVVVPLVAGIAADLRAEQVEEGFRVGAAVDGHAFCEREERPDRVSRLDGTVGVDQDRGTRHPANGLDDEAQLDALNRLMTASTRPARCLAWERATAIEPA